MFFCVVCLFAVLGNVICIPVFFTHKQELGLVFTMAAIHLVLANICMGQHVGLTLVANEVFHGEYMHAEQAWTRSLWCKVGGFLSSLSSVVSVLLVALIAVSHAVVLCFPGSSRRVSPASTAVFCAAAWCVGVCLSLTPLLPGLAHWGLQGQSGLCRLALLEGDNSDHGFRWFTVLVLSNSVWCCVILAAHCFVVKRLPPYRLALCPDQRSAFCAFRMTGKVAVTVAVCWLLLGFVTVMTTAGMSVFHQVHDVLVVFVFPLSSALSPVLWVWSLLTQRQQHEQQKNVVDRFVTQHLIKKES